MRWASAISEAAGLDTAVAECVEQVRAGLDGGAADLAVVFVSNRHSAGYERLADLLHAELPGAVLLGCSADGVIGDAHEVERRPALTLTAGHLPGVKLDPFHLEEADLPGPDAPPEPWERLVGVSAGDSPQFLLLTDPYSFHPDALLSGLDYAFPRSVKVGGLASGAGERGGNALYLGDRVYREGSVGLALTGNVVIDAVVAQGCRPVGEPMRITRCQDYWLVELDGQPPVNVLQDLFERLPERDRALARHSLFLGVVMDELCEEPRQGDFLIRNLLGIDRNHGALAIGEHLREGQIVQFHLRDAETATEDLETMLTQYVFAEVGRRPSGALLFSCTGRGAGLFGIPDHDSELFQARLGRIPLGGFFCAGEIGPVGGATFLHGYTSSFALFRSREPEAV
jgi:small ligand-binding sensory domain FIST